MSVKKYLDYAGLQRYDDNWKLKFEEMILSNDDIDDIWDEFVFDSWSITLDIKDDNKVGQIPFCLYGIDNASIKINWGDGNKETYTSNDAVQYRCPTHEYDISGEYTITMYSNDFNKIYLYAGISVQMLLFALNMGGQQETIETIMNNIPIDYYQSLKTINNKLPKIAGISGYFLTSVDNYQYENKTNTFESCFDGCSLTSIPADLFDNNTEATIFYRCFADCTSLQFIPSGLFDSNTAATNFQYCFSGCTSLQSIPSGLFDKNTAVTSFYWCFEGCTSLQSIPSGLFDKNTAVTNFESCFFNCTSIQSIPSGLFDNNTAVTTFEDCFQLCSSLASIPSGLFDNNTAVTTFKACFWGCSSLASIPTGLFDNNTAVTTFYWCFYNCTSLTSIPEGLFTNNTRVTTFYECFNKCSSLNDFTIHIGASNVSNCTDFVTKKSNTTRTVYVPNNSTTKTNFNKVASSLGLTIIGE